MSFFAILLALVLEQAHPLNPVNAIYTAVKRWVAWVARTFDAGVRHQAWITWGITIMGPALLAMLVHWALEWSLGWLLAVVWNVALLYVTLGFRQFSHHFTAIREALENGDENQARELLAEWQQVQVGQIPRSEIVRHVIEFSMIAAHRHVFGVFFWYAALSIIGLGPVGAVVYRLTELAQRLWQEPTTDGSVVSEALRSVASRAWQAMDWLPSRMTALGFAIVGSFEDAMDGWRNHAQNFPQDNDGVILAATAGAINIRLGGAALQQDKADDESQEMTGGSSTPGRIPEVAHFAQVVGLVWRTVIMWLVLVALLTMANLVG
ncbi:CobD/CbiB family protein [Limnohabitans sp. Hippo3]|uniref:CobD/CbiB family protein n=1 Tax=Limnohabitans sp. Hippo3 TaxID=1597956 RepID=UPI000D34535C|nr:CobD/CbiB family protein [Limnohabitans sp. Hippo3]PUE40388.1 cobalamin biosynthesis protein CbiB [Limnohabitans sp. Hippo3]